jgi:hypothetical protein
LPPPRGGATKLKKKNELLFNCITGTYPPEKNNFKNRVTFSVFPY